MKRFARATFYGLLTQAFALYLVFMTHGGSSTPWLLWNVSLTSLIAGPMPVVGHTQDSRPISEPTMIHLLMVVAGFALGIAVYSALLYVALGALRARRPLKTTVPE